MVIAPTYTMNDIYQLALKIEELPRLWASYSPSSQIRSTLSDHATNKPYIQTINHVNGESGDQHAFNGLNRDAIKAKTSIGIGDIKVCMILLCF